MVSCGLALQYGSSLSCQFLMYKTNFHCRFLYEIAVESFSTVKEIHVRRKVEFIKGLKDTWALLF